MLNGLWLGFFIVAAVSALAQWLIGGNAGIFAAMVESIFAMAKLSVEVMVLLFGTLTLWLGFLRIAEKAGIVEWLARALGPLFLRLMPEVPPGHPAIGLITLNFAANGLGLLAKKDRDPMTATTFGTGELLLDALKRGVKKIIVGLGGSATNDGGAGLAQALGVRFLDKNGQELPFGGGSLDQLARIDTSGLAPRLKEAKIILASDVTNPLTGPNGASAVFGPQKGATAQMIDRLDSGLRHYARIIARDLDIDVLSLEGGGAAGGMGAALYAFCGAQLRPGIEIVTDALQLAERVADADLVITGEGRIDSQTIHGKVPVGVARVAKRFNVPVIGIAGSLTADVGVVHQHGLDAVFSVLYTICTLDEALANAAANLRMTARNVAAVLQMGDRR